MRGVEVDILLPAEGNLRLVQWASTAQLWQVLERGCRVWLTPPPFDHTKLMVVDGAWVLLGSSNWDPRSLRLNFEFDLECYDRELAESLQRVAARRAAPAGATGHPRRGGRAQPPGEAPRRPGAAAVPLPMTGLVPRIPGARGTGTMGVRSPAVTHAPWPADEVEGIMPKQHGVEAVNQRSPNLLILGASGHVAQAFLRRLGAAAPSSGGWCCSTRASTSSRTGSSNTAGSATSSSATDCDGRTTGAYIGNCCDVTRLTSCST